MDPNEALRQLRTAISDYYDASDKAVGEAAERVVIHAKALDEWLSRGGFPPSEWTASGLTLPEGFIAVEKDSCEAESPSHLQCWGSYGHEKDGEQHYTGSERWS